MSYLPSDPQSFIIAAWQPKARPVSHIRENATCDTPKRKQDLRNAWADPGRKPVLAPLGRLPCAAMLVPPAFGASAGVGPTSLYVFQRFPDGDDPHAALGRRRQMQRAANVLPL
jgi:hypothetical protein